MMAPEGSITVIASQNAWRGNENLASYTASKHAVLGLVRSVALELGPRGIRVNAIAPARSPRRRTCRDSGDGNGRAAWRSRSRLSRDGQTTALGRTRDDRRDREGAVLSSRANSRRESQVTCLPDWPERPMSVPATDGRAAPHRAHSRARFRVAPVKSFGLVHPTEVELLDHSFAGDHEFFLVDEEGRLVRLSFGSWPARANRRRGSRHSTHSAASRTALSSTDEIVLGKPDATDFYGFRTVDGHEVIGPWPMHSPSYVGCRVRLLRARRSDGLRPDASNDRLERLGRTARPGEPVCRRPSPFPHALRSRRL